MSAPDLAPVRPGRALLLENIHADARTLLSEAGWEVETASGALDEAELAERLDGVSLLGIRSQTQVTAKVLEAATDLRAVGAFCIGTNQIDLFAAAAHGVAVFNAPYSNTRSVVELALAEIIALTRRLTVKDRAMHEGVWDKSAAGSHEVRLVQGSAQRLGLVAGRAEEVGRHRVDVLQQQGSGPVQRRPPRERGDRPREVVPGSPAAGRRGGTLAGRAVVR